MTEEKKNQMAMDPEAPSREAICWTCEVGAEAIDFKDPDEAIRSHLDDYLTPDMSPQQIREALPGRITLFGYALQEVDGCDALADVALENLLKGLDEEYGDPNGEPTDPSEKMKAAAMQFIAAVVAEYRVWACDLVSEVEVDVLAWVKANEPEWLGLDGGSPGHD